jgi:hypothetical protein
MPRAAQQAREVQPPQNYQTGTQRKTGFQPAQRVTPIREREQEEEVGRGMPANQGQGPLTKSGYPDRRFKGQRDLPPPEEENPEFRRARTGGTIGDVHVTIDGKPDRRFKENRGLSDEEVMSQWLEQLNERYGRTQRR